MGAVSDPEQPRAEDFALQLARLEGELKARDNHLAAMEATYEAHRAEWQAALAEAADAQWPSGTARSASRSGGPWSPTCVPGCSPRRKR